MKLKKTKQKKRMQNARKLVCITADRWIDR